MILGHFRPLFGHYKRAIAVVLAAFYTITEQVILRLLRHDFRYTSSKQNWKVPKRNRDRSHLRLGTSLTSNALRRASKQTLIFP